MVTVGVAAPPPPPPPPPAERAADGRRSPPRPTAPRSRRRRASPRPRRPRTPTGPSRASSSCATGPGRPGHDVALLVGLESAPPAPTRSPRARSTTRAPPPRARRSASPSVTDNPGRRHREVGVVGSRGADPSRRRRRSAAAAGGGEAAPQRRGDGARVGILMDLDALDPLDPLKPAPPRGDQAARRAVAVGERLPADVRREQQAARVARPKLQR